MACHKASHTNISTEDLFLRTSICKFHAKNNCNWGKHCKFAHGEEQLRPLPDFEKTSLCPFMDETNHCIHGASCLFAHNKAELRTRTFQKSLENKESVELETTSGTAKDNTAAFLALKARGSALSPETMEAQEIVASALQLAINALQALPAQNRGSSTCPSLCAADNVGRDGDWENSSQEDAGSSRTQTSKMSSDACPPPVLRCYAKPLPSLTNKIMKEHSAQVSTGENTSRPTSFATPTLSTSSTATQDFPTGERSCRRPLCHATPWWFATRSCNASLIKTICLRRVALQNLHQMRRPTRAYTWNQ